MPRFPRFFYRYFTTWAWGSYLAAWVGALPKAYPITAFSIVVLMGSNLINATINRDYDIASDVFLHIFPVAVNLMVYQNVPLFPQGPFSILVAMPLPAAYFVFHRGNMRLIQTFYTHPGKYLFNAT